VNCLFQRIFGRTRLRDLSGIRIMKFLGYVRSSHYTYLAVLVANFLSLIPFAISYLEEP